MGNIDANIDNVIDIFRGVIESAVRGAEGPPKPSGAAASPATQPSSTRTPR